MKFNIKTIGTALLATAVLTTGCQKGSTPAPDRLPQGTELGFTASIDIDPTDSDFKTTFQDGDRIGIFAVERTSDGTPAFPAASGNYVHNARWQYTGGKWEPSRTKDQIEFSGKILDIYAYYPYDSENTDPTRIEVLPIEGATTNLLTARATCKNEARLQLVFRHKFALLRTTVEQTGDGMIPTDNMTARAYFLARAGNTLDLSATLPEQELALDFPENNYLEMEMQPVDRRQSGRTFQLIVPAQTVLDGSRLFRLTQYGVSMDVDNTRDVKIEATTEIPVSISVPLDPGHIYQPGDVYPYTGLPVGMVFETGNGGVNGKAIAFDRWNGEWGVWGASSGSDLVGTSEADGLYNLSLVKEYDQWKTYYPAFGEVAARGEGWYIGAIEELIDLARFYNSDIFGINQTWLRYTGNRFTNAAGTLSSTEVPTSGSYAYTVDWVNMLVGSNVEKRRTGTVSPMRKF